MYILLFIFISCIELVLANSSTTTTFEATTSQESSSLAGPIIFGVVVFLIIADLLRFFAVCESRQIKRSILVIGVIREGRDWAQSGRPPLKWNYPIYARKIFPRQIYRSR